MLVAVVLLMVGAVATVMAVLFRSVISVRDIAYFFESAYE